MHLVEDFVIRNTKILKENVIPLFDCASRLHYRKIYENSFFREGRNVVEGQHQHRGPLGVAVAACGPMKGVGVGGRRRRRSHFAEISKKQ
jgi:hypothetical protein